MNQFIKINDTVFNLSHIISVKFEQKRLYGNFNEGCEFIPLARIFTTEMDAGADGSYTVVHDFYGDDALEVQKLFETYSLAIIGKGVKQTDFYSEHYAKQAVEAEVE